MGNEQKYGTAFAGIQGMVIEGSEKDDYYHLMNCDYYAVNAEGGGKDEVRVVNTKEREPDFEAETQLIGFVAPGRVIPDTEMKEFLESRGATIVGHF